MFAFQLRFINKLCALIFARQAHLELFYKRSGNSQWKRCEREQGITLSMKWQLHVSSDLQLRIGAICAAFLSFRSRTVAPVDNSALTLNAHAKSQFVNAIETKLKIDSLRGEWRNMAVGYLTCVRQMCNLICSCTRFAERLNKCRLFVNFEARKAYFNCNICNWSSGKIHKQINKLHSARFRS